MIATNSVPGSLYRLAGGFTSPCHRHPETLARNPACQAACASRSCTAGIFAFPYLTPTQRSTIPFRFSSRHGASCPFVTPKISTQVPRTPGQGRWQSQGINARANEGNMRTLPAGIDAKTPEEHAVGAWEALTAVRQAAPLVQCITNYVAMDLSANTLLAAGASPAMVHGEEEVEEFVDIASVLSINIGTLSEAWVRSMRLAAGRANQRGRPWVLDPVAAGATKFRTQTCLELVALHPAIIRGNASEILALSGATLTASKGVDSTHQSDDALEAARELAQSAACVVAVSGAVDLVTDGSALLAVSNGVPLLQKITATGCSVTALIGAFLAVMPSRPLEAAAYALSIFGVAAEVAAREGGQKGPGNLRVHLLDALHGLTEEQVLSLAKVSQVER